MSVVDVSIGSAFAFALALLRGCLRPLVSVDVINLFTSPVLFEPFADLADGGLAASDLLRDLPIRFLGLRFQQLGDQVALLLGGKVAAVDVR